MQRFSVGKTYMNMSYNNKVTTMTIHREVYYMHTITTYHYTKLTTEYCIDRLQDIRYMHVQLMTIIKT